MIASGRLRAMIVAAGLATMTTRPTVAAPIDLAGRCGQLFPTAIQTAMTSMSNFVRYYWVATKTTTTEIDIDLIVLGKTSANRYTGFACNIGVDKTLTVLSPTSSSGK